MKSLKEITKSNRGTFDLRSNCVVNFCANSLFNIGGSFFFHLPIETVKSRVRYTYQSKPDTRITQPQLIKQYNNGMGGVDAMY